MSGGSMVRILIHRL